MYLLYSALLTLVFVLGSPYWAYEMIRHGKYRRGLRERLGFVPSRIGNPGSGCIWVHAVSVGEVLAVSELVRRLRTEFPDRRVFVSTTTDTGQKLAEAHFGAGNVFYFPLDFVFATRRWIHALQPALVVIAETEFWPNFLCQARRSGARIAIVNARISDRSFSGYMRWRKLLRGMLGAIELFLAQTPEDARRLKEIGASAERVLVGGNLKYDVEPPAAAAILDRLQAAFAQSGAGPVLVCGSTVEDEEAILLGAFNGVLASYHSSVLVLAPRRPERFAQVADLLQKLNIPFWRRSTWIGEPIRGGVLLLDSIGELASVYALADIAFVGGSLAPRGGHNIIEPAQHGVPILVGRHTENFRDIVSFFQAQDAVRVVEPAELPHTILELLSNEDERRALGKRAAEALQAQRGATQRALTSLKSLIAEDRREARLV